MKMLVTGATGFLGGALARRLGAIGHEVIATGRSEARGAELTADGVPFEPAELDDVDRLTSLCKGCGTCASWCPSGAITCHHFTDKQITAQIDAFFAEEAPLDSKLNKADAP